MEIFSASSSASLYGVMESNEKIHDYILFGFHEGHINVTDGRYVYMAAPDSRKPLYEYTLEPSHMRSMFSPAELSDITLQEPFSFTKGCRTMKIKASVGMTDVSNYGSRLYDLASDPNQERLLHDLNLESHMLNGMLWLMKENDCPAEMYERFGFPKEGSMTEEELKKLHECMERPYDQQDGQIPTVDYLWRTGSGDIHFSAVYSPRSISDYEGGVCLCRLRVTGH